MSNDQKKIKIDLKRKETEASWIAILDHFSLRAAPTWFSWISWVLALGALHFLHSKSDSFVLAAVIAISYSLTWLYFVGFFFQFEIKGVPFLKANSVSTFISLSASGLLAASAWIAATFIAREIARFQLSS
ncbi:MAG: hypothetical protein ABJZ76_11610 [Alphaproteobacteria bacterium]